MTMYRFDGRVAVVTGAGRGIGRAYARLLAERGASVVVNDLGASTEGDGADPGPANYVAREIVDAGGKAIPEASDVSTVAGGRALIGAAVAEFGRIDVVINNAGNMRWGGPPEVDWENIQSHLAVHVGGSFNTVSAAWPHMVKQGYGRVVMTTSTGTFGLVDNVGYATAKAAVIGMTRSLTVAGAELGIKVNLIAPNAWTRIGIRPSDPGEHHAPEQMEPELVAPMAAFLAHEACEVSGGIYLAGAGRFASIFIAVTPGYVPSDPPQSTIENLAEHWTDINDESGYYVPRSLRDWSQQYMAHRHQRNR
jgi:NAD(P)-dependent dehydrogenase (short-subunit alcohol dehydrogenase family)